MDNDISSPVRRDDVPDKISGKAKYIGDMEFKDMLYARTLRSKEARARIKSIKYPDLPPGYYIVDKSDVPGRNRVKIVFYDQPFFAEDHVNYIGEPISLIVGPDKKIIMDIINKTIIEYEKLNPILSIEQGIDTLEPIYGDNNLFADYKYAKGDIKKAAEDAEYVFEGEYDTGYQEQLYMEPQGIVGDYKDNKVIIYGSIQCPYYVKNAVIECLGFDSSRVRIVQVATGGAFGGKEDYPSLLGGQAACAAVKIGKPVQIIYDRDEDIECTTKRHPSKIRLKTYLSKNYRITGCEADIILDAGAYAGLSNVVLQRAMFAAIGAYNVENIVVRGRAVATNKVPSGAFRGFGGPQAIFAVEMQMEHIAKKLGIDSLTLKIKNLLKQGDRTSTGGVFRDEIMLPQMIERVLQMSGYREKTESFKKERENGKLKGIGLSLFFHGGGFTGSGERDFIKGKVRLVKYPDDTVEILASNVEMGQGAQTTLRKIASHCLNIPIEKVIYKNPDTDRVPDSGPTVASRTTAIVGRLIYDASCELKKRWTAAQGDEVTAGYVYPEGFVWDDGTFSGDAYTSYSWGVNAVEVEIDPLTMESKINGAWGVFDIGKPIDDLIVKGQIEGGMLQGLGLGGLEVMENTDGRFLQRTLTDCIIPGAKDAPKIQSELICRENDNGPFGAKGLGELTLVGAPAAYAIAVENASGISINKIPVRPEDLMEAYHDKV